MNFPKLATALACAFFAAAAFAKPNPADITIVSPYAQVEWSTYGQYKAALHVHTQNSDGGNTTAEMIEDAYAKGYDILAITDHNFLTPDWVAVSNGITRARFDEIAAGVGRNGRGMLEIQHTNEQSVHDHLNTFFASHPGKNAGVHLEGSIKAARELGGLSRINHPGRYTGGHVGGGEGEAASNKPKHIEKYAKLFMDHPSCVGMEIINRRDGDTASDRILWDNILKETVPQGRHVWGFSDDDAHNKNDLGNSWNVFVMPANTTNDFKAAMVSGSFYAVAKRARREQEGTDFSEIYKSTGRAPAIESITVDNTAATITISASNTERIDWISDGAVVASGETLDLAATPGIGSYVRANLRGRGGVAFTQPFGVVKK